MLKDHILLTVPGRDATEEIRVSLSTYKDTQTLDVRKYWQPEGASELKATKLGVKLPLDVVPELLVALARVEKQLGK